MTTLPNIVFILADDMGFGDVGCYNPASRIPTPHMDRLASKGLRFTDMHTPSSVCTPSRYGALTGRYCWRTRLKQGVTGGYEAPLIERDRVTIASMLKAKGYRTACIGKWHVGLTFHDRDGKPTEEEMQVDFSQPISDGPIALGFDYAFYNAGCGTCAPPYGFIEGDHFVDSSFSFFDPGKDGPVGVGSFGQWRGMMAEGWDIKEADLQIADKACRFIEESAGQESPYFLYLTPNAPHEPCVTTLLPEFARGQSLAGARGDLVWLFDWVVGQVMDTLERTGQAQNTLLIVTSDNGALPGDFILDEAGKRVMSNLEEKEYSYDTYDHLSNGDWRGYKAHIWDGGHRVPFIACWPGRVEAGAECDDLTCLTDMLATFAEITGYELPANAGEDSVPVATISGRSDTCKKRDSVIQHSSFGVFSIREGKWKLIHESLGSGGWPPPRGTGPIPESEGQLYDLEADPNEQNNRWHERPHVVADLTQRLANHVTSLKSD